MIVLRKKTFLYNMYRDKRLKKINKVMFKTQILQ